MPKLTSSKVCGSAEQSASGHYILKFTPTAKRAITVAKSLGLEGDYDGAQLRTSARDAVIARSAIWFGLRATGKSLPQIGRMTGGYDHTTVLHGLKRAYHFHDADKLHYFATIMRGQDAEDVPSEFQLKRTDRDKRIHSYWKRGHSLRATALYFCVSKETVRRVVKSFEPAKRSERSQEQGA